VLAGEVLTGTFRFSEIRRRLCFNGPQPMKVHFGECVLDTGARQLLRRGALVHLSPKAFELLRLLVECRPQALSKDAIHERIWPDIFVSDDSVAKLVNELRRAIGDEARSPHLLRTVHGFGYAFTEDVVDAIEGTAAPALQCWLHWEGRELALQKPETLIGRDQGADVQLESSRISRLHARIAIRGLVAVIEDLGSRNGTYLHGQRIAAPARLTHGDEIGVGPFVLTFRSLSPAAGPETEPD